MKLNTQARTVQIEGDVNVKQARISEGKMNKLHYILTEALYKESESALIVEICNNAVDAIVESGKDPLENPVKCFINKNNITIEDRGIGMTKDFFENVFMSVLESTKEDDENLIGGWGLGGKAWVGMNRPVTFTLVKDGKKVKYLCYKGAHFIDYEILSEEDVQDEENGVTFSMDLKYGEYYDFVGHAKRKLAYYDTVATVFEGSVWENKIYRNDLFQWCDYTPYKELHLCLKDVVYTIDWNKLGIPRIDLPIALRFGIMDGINPTPSREDFFYTSETKELICNRIVEVADFFVEKYNEQVKDFPSFEKALPFIDPYNRQVNIGGKNFSIDEIQKCSSIPVSNPNIEGFNTEHLSHLKKVYRNLDRKWECIGKLDWGSFNSKYNGGGVFSPNGYAPILVDRAPIGKMREYLNSQYNSNHVFKSRGERKLWTRYSDGRISQGTDAYCLNYYNVLSLEKIPRKEWREYIIEAQLIEKEYESRLKSYIDFQFPQVWLDARKIKYSYKSKKLDKGEGEITYQFARKREIGGGLTFEKATKEINTLNKWYHLNVYFSPKEKERALLFAELLRDSKHKVILVGEREQKYLKNRHNFKTEKEFMETGVFAKYATAQKVKQVVDEYAEFKNKVNLDLDVLKDILKKHQKSIDKMDKYFWENDKRVSTELAPELMEIAEKNNMWDMKMLAVAEDVKKMLNEFSFLKFMKAPEKHYRITWEEFEEQKKQFTTTVYQLLLFNKSYHGKFDNLELVQKQNLVTV